MMTREEAKEIFLNRGYIKVEGGTIFDGDKWREACSVISKWLEQEPCEDAVSRQAVKEKMMKYGFAAPDMTVTEFIEDELPPVYPAPKTGHWIKMPLIEAGQTYSHKCSLCGRRILVTDAGLSEFPYCHCGAKMVEPQESEG